jgi:hypothetical protein
MPISREAVFKKLCIRTQPFFPEIGLDDLPLPIESLQKALDPCRDSRVINYYYDVYDWSESASVQGLAPPQGLTSFPKTVDPERPLFVIVSGTRSSGRDSLINLILHKIGILHGVVPRLLTVSDLPRSPEPAVKQVAEYFIASWPTRAQKNLDEVFDRFTRQKSTDTDVHYPALFIALEQAMKAKLTMPHVLSIAGTDSYDIWKSVYLSCRKLFDYIIVQTKSARAANACKTSMTDTTVAHIQAQPLSAKAALEYAKTRIAFERRGGGPRDDLAPLTTAAIDLLYQPGKSAIDGREQPKTIGWLRETLRSAVEKHVEVLCALVDQAALDALPPDHLLISENTLWNARQEINRGKV